MPKRTLSYEDDLLERLQDEDYAVLYLNAALEDDETDDSASTVAVFLLALRDVAKAHKVAHVAQSADLHWIEPVEQI
jgi:DNA-binding phage protein